MSAASAEDDAGPDLRSRAIYAMRNQVRPADHVDAFRRWSAQNLARSLGLTGVEQLGNPLSLVEADAEFPGGGASSTENATDEAGVGGTDASLTPAQREYLAEARRSVDLRSELARLVEHTRDASDGHANDRAQDTDAPDHAVQTLELQADVAALERQVQRAELAHRCLDSLEQLPAASPDFLDPAVMFRDCPRLPEMPRELMDSFTRVGAGAAAGAAGAAGPAPDAQELMRRLTRENLRHKILARKARQDASAARALGGRDAARLPPQVQLQALASVKNALIGWIETQLGKAGGEDDEDFDDDAGSPRKQQASPQPTQAELDTRLAGIRREYDTHIALRREIMALVAQSRGLAAENRAASRDAKQSQRDAASSQSSQHQPSPAQQAAATSYPSKIDTEAFLLTPYVEQLQILQREQKALIQEKSHINSLLAHQQEETCQLLGHLADESQLLPRFPAAAKQVARDRQRQRQEQEKERQQHGLGEAASRRRKNTAAIRHADVARQVEPWLAASDAAKLATLEAVAGRVEEGQVAVDEAMEAFEEACKLLDKEHLLDQGGPADGEDQAEDGGRAPPQKKKGDAKVNHTTIWSKLDGNLGLINE